MIPFIDQLTDEEKRMLSETKKNRQDEFHDLEALQESPTLDNIFFLLDFPLWQKFLVSLVYLNSVSLYIFCTMTYSENVPSLLVTLNLLTNILIGLDTIVVLVNKFLVYKNWVKYKSAPKSWIFILLDVASYLPITSLPCPVEITICKSFGNGACILSILKINRLIYYFSKYHAYVEQDLMNNVAELIFHCTILALADATFYYFVTKYRIKPNWLNSINQSHTLLFDTDKYMYMIALNNAWAKVLISSFVYTSPVHFIENLETLSLLLIGFFMLYGYHFAYMCLYQYTKLQHWYTALRLSLHLDYNLTIMQISEDYKNNILEFCNNVIHKNLEVLQEQENESNLPTVLINDLRYDLSIDAFRHSKLFNILQEKYLRFLSTLMTLRYTMPGDYILQKGNEVNTFHYIVSGVVEILSEEDRKTPILSLTGGTTFGASTLFISYDAVRYVKCKTMCVIQYLKRRDFIKLYDKYPEAYKLMHNIVIDRYEAARVHEALTRNIDPCHEEELSRSVLTLRWVKYTVKQLLKEKAPKKHVIKLKHLEEESWDRLFFIASYLSNLVVAEDVFLTTDSVFVKSTCPCILQPKSILIKLWTFIIDFCIVLALFLLPYSASLAKEIPPWHSPFVIIITLLWIIDIYIKLSTKVTIDDYIIYEVLKIWRFRLRELSFVLDLLAALPVEILIHTILITESLHSRMTAVFQLNRLLKIYRVGILLEHMEYKFISYTLIFDITKFVTYSLITAYIVAALIFGGVTYGLEKSYIQDCGYIKDSFHGFLYFVAEFFTEKNLLHADVVTEDQMVFINVLMTISFLHFFYLLTAVVTQRILSNYNWLNYIQQAVELRMCMTHFQFNRYVNRRIWTYLNCQYEYSMGTNDENLSLICPNWLMEKVREEAYIKHFRSQEAFQDFPDQMLRDMCKQANRVIFPEHGVIIYSGHMVDEIMLIFNGYCEMIASSKRLENRLLKPFDNIALLEYFCKIPAVHTYVATTACVVLSVKHEDLLPLFAKYPIENDRIKRICKEIRLLSERKYQLRYSLPYNIYERFQEDEEISFVNMHFDRGTIAYKRYSEPFEQSKLLYFTKSLLVNKTILPTGHFLKNWEISRCCFGMLSLILFTNPFVIFSPLWSFPWFILFSLDLMAYIDIYLQMHVCYYDERGLLISHPLKTATHYLTHRFPLDLFCCFKFELLLYHLIKDNMLQYTISKMNRIFQVHRFGSLMVTYNEEIFYRIILFYCLLTALIFLVSIFALSVLVMTYYCSFNLHDTVENYAMVAVHNDSVYEHNITCLNNSWISNSEFQKPFSIWRVYVLCIYYVTSTITMSTLDGFTVVPETDWLFTTFISFYSHVIFTLHTAVVIAGITTRSERTSHYRTSLNHLLNFLKSNKISQSIYHNVLNYYQLYWLRQRGAKPCHVYKKFPTALREDILLTSYKKLFNESSIFQEADEECVSKLLVNMGNYFATNGTTILKLNDVHEYMYIVYSGKVKVYGPANFEFGVLPPGSIFGNLDDTHRIRQTFTTVASGHVELLRISAMAFHSVLKQYPKFNASYKNQTRLRFDFLPNTFYEKIKNAKFVPESSKKRRRFLLKSKSKRSRSQRRKKSSLEEKYFGRKEEGKSLKSVRKIEEQSTGDDDDSYWKRKFSFLFKNKDKQLLNDEKEGFVLYPSNIIMKMWNLFFIIAVCFSMSFYELYIMSINLLTTNTIIYLYIGDFLFLLHMFVQSYSAYENEFGIINISNTFKHYKKTLMFKIDILILVPFEIFSIISSSNSSSVFILLRSNKLLRIIYFINYLLEHNRKVQIKSALYHTFLILLWNFLTILTTSCLLMGLSKYAEDPMDIPDYESLYSSELFITYLQAMVSLFFVSSPDNFHPNTDIMSIALCTTIILFRTMFMLCMAEISVGLQFANRNKIHFREKMNSILGFMHYCHITNGLQDRIKRYLILSWEHYRLIRYPRLLRELPRPMRELILTTLYGDYFTNSELFRNCHPDFVRQVIKEINIEIYFPGDYVVYEGTIDDHLYIVHTGEVEAVQTLDRHTEIVDHVLHTGDIFGMESCLDNNTEYRYSYRAVTITNVLMLSYQKWKYLFTFFPASKSSIDEVLNIRYKIRPKFVISPALYVPY